MTVVCPVCNNEVYVFYTWSSSRGFPIEAFLKKTNFYSHLPYNNRVAFLKYVGVPVCIKCRDDLVEENG